ncbi:ABC transporter permease [Candidatus Chloroploca asiatica]|uniref:Nitrate ABC transporter permease n=1 Tax=Candidatus Chloroploca asiatica TaxID=1506545 RepID=A0A2H3KLZ0_9CHLR|nr:ABC transporter permease [Candidatus Chloroploca asiatica]PDV99065.1 nitrate ABC transporter permease [Candidatus Chloroploca asiatica]
MAASRRLALMRRVLHQWLPPAILLTSLLVAWEVLVRLFAVPVWLLPAPSRVGQTFVESLPILGGHVVATLRVTALGAGLALVTGIGLALALDAVPLIRRAVYPLLVVSQTVPIVAIAPLLVIGLGFGLLPKVLVVALVTFFPITVSLAGGLRDADRDMVRLFQAMDASYWQTLRLLRWPAALPSFFRGLRIAVTYSVIAAVIAEWIGAEAGLGVYIARSLRAFRTDQVFVAALVTSLLTLILFALIVVLERRLLAWKGTE